MSIPNFAHLATNAEPINFGPIKDVVFVIGGGSSTRRWASMKACSITLSSVVQLLLIMFSS